MHYKSARDKRRGGWGLILGAAVAVGFFAMAIVVATGQALDEDPTTGGSNDMLVTVALLALVVAAPMLLGGVFLLWAARKERKRSAGRT